MTNDPIAYATMALTSVTGRLDEALETLSKKIGERAANDIIYPISVLSHVAETLLNEVERLKREVAVLRAKKEAKP